MGLQMPAALRHYYIGDLNNATSNSTFTYTQFMRIGSLLLTASFILGFFFCSTATAFLHIAKPSHPTAAHTPQATIKDNLSRSRHSPAISNYISHLC